MAYFTNSLPYFVGLFSWFALLFLSCPSILWYRIRDQNEGLLHYVENLWHIKKNTILSNVFKGQNAWKEVPHKEIVKLSIIPAFGILISA